MRSLVILVIGACIFLHELQAQTYEELIAKSYTCSDAGDWPVAEECLKMAMRLEPAHRLNYLLLTNLGTFQRRQGKTEEALLSYNAALGQMPNDKIILTNRAELFTETNEIDKAIFDYNAILLNFPADEQSLYNRGILYINTGEYILAQSDFERIIEINKDTFWGRFGYAILEKARENYGDSEVIFNYLADKYPNNIRILEERAELFFLTRRNRRAMTELNKVFAAIPDPSAEMYMLRGYIKLAQNEKESAAIDFKKAREAGYDGETVERLLKECL